jgi:hypothetical protein
VNEPVTQVTSDMEAEVGRLLAQLQRTLQEQTDEKLRAEVGAISAELGAITQELDATRKKEAQMDTFAADTVGFMSAIEGQYQAAVDGLSTAIEQRLQQDEADIQQVRRGAPARARPRGAVATTGSPERTS